MFFITQKEHGEKFPVHKFFHNIKEFQSNELLLKWPHLLSKWKVEIVYNRSNQTRMETI